MNRRTAAKDEWTGEIERIDDWRWRIPQDGGMRAPGVIYASESLLARARRDRALAQVANVAHLPGIVGASLAMPDIHWGYGFPIGGCAATDPADGGVVSPGGVGYDINCGVRALRTEIPLDEIEGRVGDLIDALFARVPAGVGRGGAIRLSDDDFRRALTEGSAWAVAKGFGVAEDVERTEAGGALEGADPHAVSPRAMKRGRDQMGTLGSGNHFLEVQLVEEIFDEAAAGAFGLFPGQVAVMIHCGSRGFGHQVCDDAIRQVRPATKRYGIRVPDPQLSCAPVDSDEGRRYLATMRAAANYAWANRQCIMHLVRETFERFFGRGWEELGMDLVYDVAHNIAKIETHEVDGIQRELCVHRKGATRSFPPGHDEVPEAYRAVGQPVIIPGDMGTNSYVLAGTEVAMRETFGTTCHGAGRTMSRRAATRAARGEDIVRELAERGIVVRGHGMGGIAEEQPDAYKDVNEVVDVVHAAGIARKVAKLRPLGVVKG